MSTRSKRPLVTTLVTLALAGSTLGCKEIKERAERVALRQNQVTSALMDVIQYAETEDQALAQRLYGREAELNKACAPLQHAASQTLYDEEIDDKTKMRVFRSLDPCAGKVTEVADLLWQLDPEIAEVHFGSRGILTTLAADNVLPKSEARVRVIRWDKVRSAAQR